jgi:hypothetical protein
VSQGSHIVVVLITCAVTIDVSVSTEEMVEKRVWVVVLVSRATVVVAHSVIVVIEVQSEV